MKSNELSAANRCHVRRSHGDLTLWSEKTPTINKPMACRRVLLQYLEGKITSADVPAALAKEFDSVGYVNPQQKAENLNEMTKQVMRYINAEKAAKGTR